MVELKDLKEIKIADKVIPINWSYVQLNNRDMMEKEIMSAIIDANIYYLIDSDRSKKRKEAKELALLHWINQLKIGYLKFFKENKSFEAIFEEKKFKFLGIQYQIEINDGIETAIFEDMAAKLIVPSSNFEHKKLLIMDISKTIHEILLHVTAYEHIPHYTHQFNALSILPIFVDNDIDTEFFGGNEELMLSKINIGCNKYKLSYQNLGDNTYGNIDKYRKKIELNSKNSLDNKLHTLLHEIVHGIFKEWDINVSEIYKRTQLSGGKVTDKDKIMEEEIVARLSSGLVDVFLNNDNNLYNHFSYVKPKIVNFKMGDLEINRSNDDD
ncbi:hypothetical protein QH639_14930 [Lysinibacillus sp. 1 U-2021]|uniref:hypothetical protein n=1 Tax=Lysinibacillus sp. 1 U-2021 TaxID=3039426 RepID=UPI00248143FB|nr:hypothetical protein [Lysinibacillus sp. 1 U-2021]WGT37140.1 hypothetical protein QH639_14930 [Lysinibacillus sp. 1 U-2021]